MTVRQRVRSRGEKVDLLMWLYDGGCFWCGQPVNLSTVDDKFKPTLDELLPRSRGGRRNLINQVLAHGHCNQKRGNMIAAPEAVKRHRAALRLFCDDGADLER